MRLGLLLVLLFLSGCEKPTVRGCEEFIKSTLKAPSTYHRISVSSRSRISSWDELDVKGALDEGMKKHSGVDPWIYTVEILYEAKNSFGVTVRRKHFCQFDTLEQGEPIEMNVEIGVSKALRHYRDGETDLRNNEFKDNPERPACCLFD